MASSYTAFATAFYTKTNVGAVVGSGKLSGIYEGRAPQGTAFPYGVYNLQAAEPVEYAFNVTPVLEILYLQMRVYGENQKQAEDLLETWVSTLGNTLTVSGFTVEWLAKQNRLPNNDQLIDGRYIYGRGMLTKIGMS